FGMTLALLAPFIALTIAVVWRYGAGDAGPQVMPSGSTYLSGILVAMWNYMGWDNASTFADEVDRPQRTYPLAMISTVALVALSYLIPVAAVARTGVDPSSWHTGSWVDVAKIIGG